jgi:signal transduction histidine kinase
MTVNFRRSPRRRSIALGAGQAAVLREVEALRAEVAGLRASRRRLALRSDAESLGIERALHDGVQQHLVGLAANIELAAAEMDADPAAAKRLLADMGRDARQAIEETRELAERIYPPLLEAGGLPPAVRSAAARVGVPTRIDIDGAPRFPREISRTIYLCCLDVIEHVAPGNDVAIAIRSEEGRFDFDVVADGKIEGDRQALQDRVEALGGRLTIERTTGGRTRLAGSLPVSG